MSLSDDANEYVIADAVMLVPQGAAPNTATWTLSVPQTKNYRVYARWTQHPNRASDAKYTVTHAAGPTTVTVDQMAGGGGWSELGTWSFNAGSATVSLTDQANGFVIADAVMMVPTDATGNAATWTPNVAQAGQYEVYARWTAHANRATNATYTITHASGSTAVAVDQQQNGGTWNLLGTFTLAPGTAHKVTLTDEANGYVIADAVRLVQVSVQAQKKLYFVHVDHLNSPRLVADETQKTVWKWEQDEPFGANAANEDPDADTVAFEMPLRFPGQRFDAETNLHYNYFRDYDPAVGRFVQSDPIGLRGGSNTYLYVDGSPVVRIDPEGDTATVVLGGFGGLSAGAGASVVGGAGVGLAVGGAFLGGYAAGTAIYGEYGESIVDILIFAKKGRWTCTAKCNHEAIPPNNCCQPPHLTGQGTGHSEEAACRAAKRDATGSASPGCYGRHCRCTACWKN